jgi:hypothetical protein
MNRFTYSIIMFLVLIILLQRGCTPKQTPCPDSEPQKEVVIDTQYLLKDTVIIKYVTQIKRDTIPLPGDTVFLPDSCYDSLKLQFESLAKNYVARNIYRDTLLLDSFGHVIVYDTIQYNRLKQHTYMLSYVIPTITKTVTLPPKKQVYAGGGLSVNTALNDLSLQGGLLYKNKREQIYGLYILTDGKRPAQIGVSSYWKISFKK